MRKKASEKVLEAALVREAHRAGCHALKFTSLTEPGYPDRLVLMPGGRVLWVELKSGGEKPRRLQEIRHKELRGLGFEVTVVSSAEHLQDIINQLKQRTT